MFLNGKRSQKGISTIVLGTVIGVFVLFVCGLFGFEVNRIELAREQLASAADAAALAGAATLASSNDTDTATAQTQAMNTALTTFQQNSILGTSLADAYTAGSTGDNPGANNASIFVQFLDPNNNNQPVSLGDANGKIVQVTAAFGLQPSFGKFLGLNQLPIYQTSQGGVPELDVVLCFDVSASIDDQTPVTFVKRYWNSATSKNVYQVTSAYPGSPAGSLAEGTIYGILGPPAVGSSVDGIYPQNLFMSNYPGENQYPLNFSEDNMVYTTANGLRGATNAGSPPGNYPPGKANLGNQYTYTDLVVNIDGKNTFGGTSVQGTGGNSGTTYNFPDLATLVEASRGNLENTTVFQNSKASVSVPSSVTPQAGYQAAYFAAAANNLHPLHDAQVAAQDFFQIMNTNTNAHFSLVCFTSNAGTSASSTYSAPNVDQSYSAGGTGNFPVPMLALSPVTGNTNYTQALSALPTTVAISGTNIGDAVNTAVTQLTKNSRPGSTKAIVLFTDGEPTSAGPLSSDPWANARAAAVLAQKAGIPVYTIGLAQIPAIIPSETSILNDTDSNPSSGGMAAIAGNGGKFFLVTNTQDLQLTFENIARQLVQLVK